MPLSELLKDMMKITFLNRLNPTIRAEVISRQHLGLDDIMKQAHVVKDKDMVVKMAIEMMDSGTSNDVGKAAQPLSSKGNGSSMVKSIIRGFDSVATCLISLR